jgi:hypothetical protein
MIAQGIHLRFKKEGHRNAGGHRPGMSSGTASTTRRTKKKTPTKATSVLSASPNSVRYAASSIRS